MKRGTGRPTTGYYNAAGKRVASVTTVNQVGSKDGMIYKAKKNWHEAGRLGHPFERDAYWPDDPAFWGTDAAQTGSIVHQWIEDDIHGDPLTRFDDAAPVQLNQATQAYEAFRVWRSGVNLEIVATELPLVSEEYQYAGTLDALAVVLSGSQTILDWKSSNSVYTSHISQLAAYRQLVNENGYGPVENAYLLRVGKTYGEFTAHYWPKEVLDDGWQLFLHAKEAYMLDKKLSAVTK